MKKEIGSIFPLDSKTISQAEVLSAKYSNKRFYYSLCREALFDIAVSIQKSNKTVLIPAYTCQTVITPFEEVGWNCIYYSIKKNLRIDIQSLTTLIKNFSPTVLVVHPYFGMELNNQEETALQQISEKGIKIVLDLTQCIFSKRRYPFITYTIGSYRKWFPIPDGGFMERNINTASISQPEKEHNDFTEREIAVAIVAELIKFGRRAGTFPKKLIAAAVQAKEPFVLAAIIRRKLKGERISTPDKSHFHHVLMNGMGLGQVGAVLTIYVATALFGLTAYLYVVNRPIGLILLVFLIILFELFIEYTGMISPKYRPILSLVDRMTNKKESEE